MTSPVSDSSSGGRRQWPRWVKAVLLVLAGVVLVFVLFTWVFPWITEMGFNPAME